jgi:antitoxin ParD1/3/4
MAIRESMNVSLTPELAAFVERLVSEGAYRSASEVVRDGLRLLEREAQQRLLEKWLLGGLSAEEKARLSPELLKRAREVINQKIGEGLSQLERGEFVDGGEFFAKWQERLKTRTPGRRVG